MFFCVDIAIVVMFMLHLHQNMIRTCVPVGDGTAHVCVPVGDGTAHAYVPVGDGTAHTTADNTCLSVIYVYAESPGVAAHSLWP